MSRKVSSIAFKLEPGSAHKLGRSEGNQNLTYGSKKMRNQANCAQYFLKAENSKRKPTPEHSKSLIIDKDKTKTLKKSVSRSALLLPESEFYEKVSKQLSGKLSLTKDSNYSQDMQVCPQFNELLKASRVVNDEAARKSLATLAEEVCYVPKLLSDDNSSHKKPHIIQTKIGHQPFTRPFGRSEMDVNTSIDRVELKGAAAKLQRSPNMGSIYDSKNQDNTKRSNFSSKNEGFFTKNSAYSSDFKQSSLKRNLLRKQMNQKSGDSTATIGRKDEFLDTIENKIERALERSRSRGRLADFTHQIPSALSTNNSYGTSKIPYSSTGELRLIEGSRDFNSTEHNNHWGGATRSTNYPRDGTSSAIDLRDYAADKENYVRLNTLEKSKPSPLDSNSDLKFFQKRNFKNSSRVDSIDKKRYADPGYAQGDYQSKGACTLDRIDLILKEVMPIFKRDYTPINTASTNSNDRGTINSQGIDIGQFNSFKEDLRQAEYPSSSNNDYRLHQHIDFGSQSNLYGRLNDDNHRSHTDLNRNLSRISGISRNIEGERFTYDEIGTPSLLQANKGVADRSGNILIKGELAGETARAEESTSRQGPIELNHNFVRRTWNLRFTSSQELKVLVAESIIFIGDKKNGLKCGKGKFITERSGVVLYEGGFYDNLYHGFGRLINPKSHSLSSATWYYNLDEIENWVKYEGNFSGGLPEGIGTLHISTGEYMTAEFTRGRVTGPGTIYNSSGSPILSAEWSDNLFPEKPL